MSVCVEQGLLGDIIENPHDDLPRLVYADWLESQGDVAKSLWIRAGVANPEREVYEFPCGQPAQLSGALPYLIWRRGFITEVHCTNKWWFENGASVATRHPVELVQGGCGSARQEAHDHASHVMVYSLTVFRESLNERHRTEFCNWAKQLQQDKGIIEVNETVETVFVTSRDSTDWFSEFLIWWARQQE
jgi:uncharacterized protein (TIGR02996 family)